MIDVFMIPIVAIVVWSPIGRAIGLSIQTRAEVRRAKAERLLRPSVWDALGQRISGAPPVPAPTAQQQDPDLAERIKALEEEIQHLREAAVMAPFPHRTSTDSSTPTPADDRPRNVKWGRTTQ